MKTFMKLFLLLAVTTLIFQGAGCASREMTTAKVAIKNGDVPKAVENLQKEIAKNPQNGEAYILLAEIEKGRGNLQTAMDLMTKAEPLVKDDPNLRDRPALFNFNVFKDLIEKGERQFSKYEKAKNKKASDLDSAIATYKLALQLRPAYFDGYARVGYANELLERADSAIAAYLKYIEVLQPSFDIANEKGFAVGTDDKQLHSVLGAGTTLRGSKLSTGDTTTLEHYKIGGKDLYVYSIGKEGQPFKVVSWSYNPPLNILQGERELMPSMLTQPILSVAAIYYAKKDLQNSLKYFKLAQQIEPQNENTNSALVTLYNEMGHGDVALQALKENIAKNPNNPIFVAQLGDIYMNKGEYDAAIEQYDKALKIDANFADALRNIASCYGNKAAIIQKEQIELVKAGKQKTPDVKTYSPDLLKSAEYFEKCLKTKKFGNDPDVLGDLAGIYMALLPGEQAKFNATMSQLESVEGSISADRKEAYYLKLLKIYGQINSPKYSEIETKINSLNK